MGAFNRIFIHPDLSRLTITELDGRLLGLGENVMVSRLVLPFGRIASPAYFQLFGTAIQALRESYGMDDVGRPGSGHLSSFICVEDAIWVANAFGSRLTGSVASLEWECKRILNEGAVNDRKKRLGGERSTNSTILGFAIDAEANWI